MDYEEHSDGFEDCNTLIPDPEHPEHEQGDYTEITVVAYLRLHPDGTLELSEFNTEDRMDVEHYNEKDGHLHDVHDLSDADDKELLSKIGELERKLLTAQKSS